ncbi:MAG: hypothetical protein ACNS60_16705 [Candidatus Cyclobacteriaceae bacterium M2_1C_046]
MIKVYTFIIPLLLISSCNKEEEITFNPQEALLGKWETTKIGSSMNNLHDIEIQGYTEYLNDTTYRYFDYDSEEYTYGDYSLNDSTLINYYYAVH